MTNEETAQVNAYITNLTAQHNAAMNRLQTECTLAIHKVLADQRKAFEGEQVSRKLAQADSLKMGQAVHEIWKLANTQSTLTPTAMAQYVRQIIDYYCPDFDIPF